MIVAFRRPWWNGHERKHYPRDMGGVFVPDEYRDLLPSTSRILDAVVEEEEIAAPPVTLSELAKLTASDTPGVKAVSSPSGAGRKPAKASK